MHKIKEMLMQELYEYEDKAARMSGVKVSTQDLEKIHKLTDTIKNIDKIEMLEEDGGYSEDGHYMGEGRIYGTSYDGNGNSYGDNSYARGRSRAKRDSMGRYSRDGGGMSYRGGYSREGAKDHLMEKLEDMMEMAENPKEREALQHCMKSIERA